MSDLAGSDRRARSEATDPAASFIVQAPAGSGKTSLLTQRFLRLLAHVERPEEIVAITFTRKAAAEMRHRIIAALAAGASAPPGGNAAEHERQTWLLARDALENGRRQGWDLDEHPSRLHIRTIDGLNHWLSGKLPLSARVGLSPQLLDDARPVYDEAARRFVSRIEQAEAPAAAIRRLVRLLDHDPRVLQDLLAGMLARRELWLPKLLDLRESSTRRADMEQLLSGAVAAELARIRREVDCPLLREILGLLREASTLFEDSPLAPLAGADDLPPNSAAARAQWSCLVAALLTADGAARKAINRNQGFPPELKAEKSRMKSLLERLAGEPALVGALARVMQLPPDRYTDEQWERVAALCEVLVPAAAELQAVFGEHGLLDHAAVAAAARQALGQGDAPSELAQALEYRIRHVLVDEYQDTSPVQESLLERLVAGWQPGDGHSLFCVGDPMQSIYGFREADVTLFLQAQARGIGGVPLRPRSLARNFRSCGAIIDWVNDVFARLLPEAADFERGAVPYTASECTRADEAGAGVRVHALVGRDEGREAGVTAGLVESSLRDIAALEAADREAGREPEQRQVVVLVRSRASLPPLLAELRRRGVEYRGVELESLASRAAVRDLLALTRALLHAGDRTAWLAVLRAPWCGLTLADLHTLAAGERQATILSRLGNPANVATLSADGQQQVTRVLAALEAAIADRGRRCLGSWVRSCWLALDGPATLTDGSDLENAEACFAALDQLGLETGTAPSATQVESAVDGLMASPVGSPSARVQLMTIHKAKGLEFDTVILPGLERTVTSGPGQLLYWAPVALQDGTRGIVLASRGGEEDDPRDDTLEAWMKRLEQERSAFELGRLAYVAATRARRALHLVGSVAVSWKDPDNPVLKEPSGGSLLGFFWPAVHPAFEQAFGEAAARGEVPGPVAGQRPRRGAPPFARLAPDFNAPAAPPPARPAFGRRVRSAEAPVRPHFDWAGEEAIAVGTIVHAEIERLAAARQPASSLALRPGAWRSDLLRLGIPEDRCERVLDRIASAIGAMAASPTAAALLDPASTGAASELALTAWLDGEFVSIKIDRSFVDVDGTRWIVDWKTSAHEGGSLEAFLEQEVGRYAAQLGRYARVMRLHDPRPQRIGLYFPLLDRWKEWRPDGP
jgi:ATP-dependent exoDNAse (exonuclease V) beta subunit